MGSKQCKKCGFFSEKNKEKFETLLCPFCLKFSPKEEEDFKLYVSEKVDEKVLTSFRKGLSVINEEKKDGMERAVRTGRIVSRAPFGYRFHGKNLVPADNFREVEEIFEKFLNEKISLRQLSNKHKLSVNGLKKILTNFTYIGKVKFNKSLFQGEHQQIISSTLFNHVQDKLENLKLI